MPRLLAALDHRRRRRGRRGDLDLGPVASTSSTRARLAPSSSWRVRRRPSPGGGNSRRRAPSSASGRRTSGRCAPGAGPRSPPRAGRRPARRQAPSAPSAATIVPAKPEARSRSRLRRRCRLGPAPTTMAASPAPSGVSAELEDGAARCAGGSRSALASPTPATRSKVAASSALAIFRPSSISLALLVTVPGCCSARCPRGRLACGCGSPCGLSLAPPHQALLAHEADAAAEARERFPLELVGRVGGVRPCPRSSVSTL